MGKAHLLCCRRGWSLETFDRPGIQAERPRDAPWGERYFHMRDPDGHELSFARPYQS
jgi:uncharacterized glyoxalase superfamily protein PhnB